MLHLNIINKNKKKILLVIVILLILLFSQNIFAIVKPTEEFYVNDYAKVLNDELKKYIIETNKNLKKKTGAEVVVVIVNDLESKAIEEYATELFREFKIGDSTKNNGLLILLSINDRNVRIEVGYGLEGILPDAKTGRIQDEFMIPYFKENDWNNGIMNGYNQFIKIISQEYNANIETKELTINTNKTEPNVVTTQQNEESLKKEENALMALLAMFFLTIIIGIVISVMKAREKINNRVAIVLKIIYIVIMAGIISLFIKDIATIFFISAINIALINSKRYQGINEDRDSKDRMNNNYDSNHNRKPPTRNRWFFWWWRKFKKFLKS